MKYLKHNYYSHPKTKRNKRILIFNHAKLHVTAIFCESETFFSTVNAALYMESPNNKNSYFLTFKSKASPKRNTSNRSILVIMGPVHTMTPE